MLITAYTHYCNTESIRFFIDLISKFFSFQAANIVLFLIKLLNLFSVLIGITSEDGFLGRRRCKLQVHLTIIEFSLVILGIMNNQVIIIGIL